MALQRALVASGRRHPPRAAALGSLTVFVDDWRQRATIRGRTDRWSHLLADSEEELHALAEQLGIPRRGYQRHRRSPALNHYDLPERYREQAIELGAVPVTWRQMARLTREWRRADAPPARPDQP